jgi:hypothetical protein
MRKIWIAGCVLTAGSMAFVLPAQEPASTAPKQKQVAVAVEFAGNKTVKGSPFSAVEVTTTTQTLADGSRIVRTFQRKVYRDSQGRERAEQEPTMAVLGEQVSVAMVTIADPVAGVTYNLDPSKSVARRIPRVNFSLANGTIALGAGRLGTPVKEQLPPDTIEGVYAQGTRTTTTIPAGQIGNEKDLNVVDETWYSPDLQLNVMTRHNDPRSGEMVYKLTNIVRAEPAGSLFQVPAGYTIMDPPKTSTLFVTSPDGKTTTGPITIPLPQ